MPLHDDTTAFLEARDALRTQLAAALRGETAGTPAEQLQPGVTQYGVADICEPEPRGGVCEIGAFPRFECLRDAKGWPNTDALYETLYEAVSNASSPDNSAASQIQLMRQVNLMESYRKMLLHKKQGVGQYMAAWCACLAKEPQSLEELRMLLLNQAIGQTVTPPEPVAEP